MDILILGAGVSGLSSGIALLEKGHQVTIWAKAVAGSQRPGEPPAITSEVAAAVWYPYKAYPQDRVNAWGEVTYDVFQRLSASGSTVEHGIVFSEVLEVLPNQVGDPWWLPAVRGSFRHAGEDELPPGYSDGYVFRAPVIDMSIYLGYLARRFTRGGGILTVRSVSHIDEALGQCPVVINCTGLGAREVVGDQLLYASRGQVVRIRKPDNFPPRVVMDDSGPNHVAYIVPRLYDVVLGGIDAEHDETLRVDPQVTASILARCANLVPEIAHILPESILDVVCGLRPVRPSVRLELEKIAGGSWVVHNYGHGGAGVTLSWGCADEVVQLVGSIPATG